MSKTILLVEDYDDTRELLRVMLELLGCQVVEATDGREAVECAASEHLDLILMDIGLPTMDGITATRIIKQKNQNPDVPVVCLTAHSSNYHEEALRAGCDKVITKPVDFNGLSIAVTPYLAA